MHGVAPNTSVKTTASGDLTRYQELAPDNLVYDKSGKTYRAAPDFTPLYQRVARCGELAANQSLPSDRVF